MIRRHTLTVAASGSAGSATGSGRTTEPVNGLVMGVYLDYSASAAATGDVSIATVSPAVTVLSVANNATDGLYLPRVAARDTAGAVVTFDGTNEIYEPIPVTDYVTVSLAQMNDGDTVTVTLWVKG